MFCIIPFLYPDKYVKQYERLIQSFIDFGLPMGDDCHKRISQPRFVSWNNDSTQFFNHDAKLYHLLPPEKTFHSLSPRTKSSTVTATPENAFIWCNEQINKSHSFTEGNRHQYIVRLARYCNMKGISEEQTLSGCSSYVLEGFSEGEIKNIVKHIYTTQKNSHNKYPFKGS
jgi:hypothetical protein